MRKEGGRWRVMWLVLGAYLVLAIGVWVAALALRGGW
jgi:hypothetical protein